MPGAHFARDDCPAPPGGGRVAPRCCRTNDVAGAVEPADSVCVACGPGQIPDRLIGIAPRKIAVCAIAKGGSCRLLATAEQHFLAIDLASIFHGLEARSFM